MAEIYVPMARWGRDHWRCLAYVEAVAVEMAGFQVGADPRMTANRRHFRILAEHCPRPRRPNHPPRPGLVMQPEYATRLADGSQPDPAHDDWCCVQDMAAELRQHKAAGHPIGAFRRGQDNLEEAVCPA